MSRHRHAATLAVDGVLRADLAAQMAEARAMAPEAPTVLAVAKPTAIARAEKRMAIVLRGQVARPVVRVAAVLRAARVRGMAWEVAVRRTMQAANVPVAGRARRDRRTVKMADPMQGVPVAAHARRPATGRADADSRDGLDARGVG